MSKLESANDTAETAVTKKRSSLVRFGEFLLGLGMLADVPGARALGGFVFVGDSLLRK